jgi:hypothetical protein
MLRAVASMRIAPPSSLLVLSSRRGFFGTLDPVKERRLKQSSIAITKPRGRDIASDSFERKIHIMRTDAHGAIWQNTTDRVAVVDLVDPADLEANIIQHPSTVPHLTALAKTRYDERTFKNLRRNADTWAHTYISGQSSVIHLVDPNLNHAMFKREEAQVEMITAYRNALFEFYDLCHASSPGAPPSRLAFDTLRIPALCLYSSDYFQHDLGKLNQQALLKGFHRTPNHVKDWFTISDDIRVVLYVPGEFIEQFEKAFSEEPWLPLTSTVMPTRTALYPGMPVPRQMLDYPGWVGKRQELLDAPATDGRSIEAVRVTDASMLRKSREALRLPRNPTPDASQPLTHVDEHGNKVELTAAFEPNVRVQREVADREAEERARRELEAQEKQQADTRKPPTV